MFDAVFVNTLLPVVLVLLGLAALFWRGTHLVHTATRHNGTVWSHDFVDNGHNGFVLYEKTFDDPEGNLVLTVDIKSNVVYEDTSVILHTINKQNPNILREYLNQYFGELRKGTQKYIFSAKLTADELRQKTVVVYLRFDQALLDQDRKRFDASYVSESRKVFEKGLQWGVTEKWTSHSLYDCIIRSYETANIALTNQ